MSATTMSEREEKTLAENPIIHKLKLHWMMTKDEAEKRSISLEIRRNLESSP